MTEPRELFLHELRDILYAEKQIAKALPLMAKEAGDEELRDGLRHHLEETREQIANLERVFEQLGERAKGEQCPGIEGIITEHDEFMSEEDPEGGVRDVFLTGAAARTEHYEIAAYTGLISLATALGERDCAELLRANLAQEKEMLKTAESLGRRIGKEAVKAGKAAAKQAAAA
jgi:ferritin-like metal-binding protein YciE